MGSIVTEIEMGSWIMARDATRIRAAGTGLTMNNVVDGGKKYPQRCRDIEGDAANQPESMPLKRVEATEVSKSD